jgi:hypothetical protein
MPAPIARDAPLALAPAVVSTSIPGETVILDASGDRYYSLEGVGDHVWGLLQRGPTTAASIVAEVVATYEVDPDVGERDVQALLADLVERRLVVVGAAAR